MPPPDNGVVVERNCGPGDLVADATHTLFQLANLDRLLVVATVPENELPATYALMNAVPRDQRAWTIRAASVYG